MIFAALFKLFGKERIMKLFPPVVCGVMILLIGVILAPTAVSMAATNWLLAIIAIVVVSGCAVFGRGMVKIIPIILGIVIAYAIACIGGWANLKGFTGPAFALPTFV